MSLKKGAFIFAAGTLLSRITGMIRESTLAAVFGANLTLDAFFLAQRLPNLLRDLLAEGALASSFTKTYTDLCQKNSFLAQKLLAQLFVLIVFFLIFCIFLGSFEGDYLSYFLFWGKTEGFLREQTMHLFAWTCPFLALMVLGALAMGVLQQERKMFWVATAPIALNLGYIFGALWGSYFFTDSQGKDPRLSGLGLGLVLGGIGQVLWQIFAGRNIWWKLKDLSWKDWFIWGKEMRQVGLLFFPLALGSGLNQVGLWFQTHLAAQLPSGGISYLTLSFRLFQLPVGLFGVGIGMLILPQLTESLNSGSSARTASRELGEALTLMLWLLLPCFFMFWFQSLSFVKIFYEYGAFVSTKEVSQTLKAYNWGVIAYGSTKILTSYYCASGRSNVLWRLSFLSLGTLAVASLVGLAHGSAGLAFASSLSLWVQSLFLFHGIPFKRNIFRAHSLFGLMGGSLVSLLGLRYFCPQADLSFSILRSFFCLIVSGFWVLISFGIFYALFERKK